MWKILLAVVLLTGSTFIYLIFRTDETIGFKLLSGMGLGNILYSLKNALLVWRLLAFVVYSLPDGLWLLSYMLVADALIPVHPVKALWLMALPANAISTEIAQYWHIMPGIYDMQDMACYLVPTIAYMILWKNASTSWRHIGFEDLMFAPLLLVGYLWLAGASVDRLHTPFVIVCAIFCSALMVINYILLQQTRKYRRPHLL